MRIGVFAEARLRFDVGDPFVAVSDLHSGGAGRQNNFHQGLFLDFLDQYVRPEHLALYLLGDIVDTYETPSLRAWLRMNWIMIPALAVLDVRAVPGNHDDVLAMPDHLESEYLLAWHGHQLDPACRGRGTLGKIGGTAWGAAERLGLSVLFRPLKRIAVRWNDRRMGGIGRSGDSNAAYMADALEWFEGCKARSLYLCGHSHKPELVEYPFGRVFANCGSWVDTLATGEPVGWAVEVRGVDVRLLEIRH